MADRDRRRRGGRIRRPPGYWTVERDQEHQRSTHNGSLAGCRAIGHLKDLGREDVFYETPLDV